MKLPPKWLRRAVLAPLVIVLTLLMLATMPLSLLVAAFISRYVPGRWRPLRLIWFAFVWLVFESIVIVAMFSMWVASGFGWMIRWRPFENGHYRLMAWFLRRVVGSARFTFGLDTVADGPIHRHVGRPILVMARHAGPGDSLLLVDALLNRFQRHPRIVLKDTLQWDPAIDIALNRVPSRFISTRHRPGDAAVRAIGQLAETLGERDALVIFPEGGNYTPARWTRAIDKLRDRGLIEYAERAEEMKLLLPPKPAGVLAAVAGAPDAAIVLVGHAGLEHMDTIADVWSGMRMDITVHTRVWTYLVSDLPSDRPALETWLYDRWAEMNHWLEETERSADEADDLDVSRPAAVTRWRHRASTIRAIVEATYRSWRDDRTIRLGAGLAYYSLFGVVPFVTLAVYIAGLAFSLDEIQAFVFESAVRLLGQTDAEVLADSIASEVGGWSTGGSLGLIGLVALVFSSSLLFAALQDALNVIFDVPVESGIRLSLLRRLWLFGLVLGLASLVLASLILQTVVQSLLRLVRLDDETLIAGVFAVAGPVITLLIMALVLAVLYRTMPQAEVSWRPAIVGAFVAVAVGSAAGVLVQWYLGRFATGSVQGAAGGIAAILTLVYVLSQIVLACAHLTKVLDRRSGR